MIQSNYLVSSFDLRFKTEFDYKFDSFDLENEYQREMFYLRSQTL